MITANSTATLPCASPPWIGIDVAKNSFDVALGSEGPVRTLSYDAAGFRQLDRILDRLGPSRLGHPRLCLEATGGYERRLLAWLARRGVSVARINPRQIRRFAQATGRLDKTDRLDARLIALYAERLDPDPDPPFAEAAQKRKDLDARRRQIVEQITREKNRLGQCGDPDVRRLIEESIRLAQDQLRRLDELIAQAIAADPQADRLVRRLASVPGVGAVTAARLATLLPELGQLNRREIARLAGLAPVCRDSGTLRGKRTIGGGRPEVRTTLYMATLVAVRHNPLLGSFYQRLVQNGKAKMTALTAAMRKLLTLLNTLVKTNTDWKPLPQSP